MYKRQVIFSGNTKPFQAEFTTQEIKLKVQKITGVAHAEYYRVMENVQIDPGTTSCVEKLQQVLGNILYSSPVLVQLNDKKHDTELAQQVIAEIKKPPNVEVRD